MNSKLIDQHLIDLLSIPAEEMLKNLHPGKTSKDEV
jgi:hypothetical protein